MNYHPGETLVQFQCHKRRQEIAQLLEALLEKPSGQRFYVVWDYINTHEDDEVEAAVRAVAGRLVLLYLPITVRGSIRLKCVFRRFRWEVTDCKCFETKWAQLAAPQDFFDR